MNDEELGRLIASVAPKLPNPPDRAQAVRRRAHRRQQRIAMVATAAITAFVLAAGAVVISRTPEPSAPPRPIGTTSTPPPIPVDNVLRTPGCATYSNAGPTAIDGTPVNGNTDVVNALNNRIVPYATKNFADVYGVTSITDNGRMRVYRKPSAAFDAWILHDFSQDCVEVADAKASQAEIEQWMHRIETEAAYWKSKGLQILQISGNPVTGVINVGVAPSALEQARQEMPARYPDLTIDVIPTNGAFTQ